MQLTFEDVGAVVVGEIPVEELDAGNAAEFRRDITPTLDAHTRVVLDLSRLRFVDSSGLGVFISCLRKLNAKGGELKLCCLSPDVRSMFELVRLHRVFDIFETRDEAVRAFA